MSDLSFFLGAAALLVLLLIVNMLIRAVQTLQQVGDEPHRQQISIAGRRGDVLLVLATVAFTLCTIAMASSWAGAKSAATDEHYRRLEESLQRERMDGTEGRGVDYPTSTDQSFQYDVEGG